MKRDNIVYRGEEDNKKDHECVLDDHNFRCKICGRCLKWTVYGIHKDTNPFEQKMKRLLIDCYKYEFILDRVQKQNEITQMHTSQKIFSIKNFTQFANASSMRDFIYFILCLPLGYGFSNQIKSYRERKIYNQRMSILKKNNISLQNIITMVYQDANGQRRNTSQQEEIKILPPMSVRDLQLIGDQSPEIEFFGDFEGSNFLHAFYDPKNQKVQIILKADTNTDGFTSWFYFGCRVKTNSTMKITFEILNCRKEKSLFQTGMNVCIAKLNNNIIYNNFLNYHRYWRRDMGFEIKYQESTYPRKVFRRTDSLRILPVTGYLETDHTFMQEDAALEEKCEKVLEMQKKGIDVSVEKERIFMQRLMNNKFIKNYYHSLTFSYQFQINSIDTTVLFSQCLPYTFSNLIEFIEVIETNIKQQNPLFRYTFDNETRVYNLDCFNLTYEKTIIGASNLGLPITELQITAPNTQRSLNLSKRPYIFIIARQHPNETPGSFVCQGLIKFLLSNEPEAVSLRQIFIFKHIFDMYYQQIKIIPMVNPDGVVIGNSRASIKGIDLNRSWENSNETPEISCIKERMRSITSNNGNIFLFLDLHGHQTKLGSFLLCTIKEEASNFEWAKVRLLPKILAENCKFFDIDNCKYSFLPAEKSCSGREYAWRNLKVEHSYTLETSFFGSKPASQQDVISEQLQYEIDDGIIHHYSVQDYEYIGEQTCKSILQFSACVTLMLEQALLNENVDITQEQLLTGQLPEGFAIPQSELSKVADQSLLKQMSINASGDNSFLLNSKNSSPTNKDREGKSNMKSTSIAISKMLKLKQILEEKEKSKADLIFSDQRSSSKYEPQYQGSKPIAVDPQELQAAITQQGDQDEYRVNVDTEIINGPKITDIKPKAAVVEEEVKKQTYFMGFQQAAQQQTSTLRTQNFSQSSHNAANNANKKGVALNKFQQYVIKTKEQIKALFMSKKGLDWHKFYDKDDVQDLKQFQEQQQQQQQQQQQPKENKNDSISKSMSKIDLNLSTKEEGVGMKSTDLEDKCNDSDSEPEDDYNKKYQNNGESGEIDGDGNELTLSQQRLKQLEDEKNKRINTLSSDDNGVNSDDQLLLSGNENENANNPNGRAGTLNDANTSNPNQNLNDKDRDRLNTLNSRLNSENSSNDQESNAHSSFKNKNKSTDKVLLPSTQFMYGLSSKIIPFGEKIILKSPFLPTQNEIFEAYSIKSPLNIKNLSLKKAQTEENNKQFSQYTIFTSNSGVLSNQQIMTNPDQKREQKSHDDEDKLFFRQAESSVMINQDIHQISEQDNQETFTHTHSMNSSQILSPKQIRLYEKEEQTSIQNANQDYIVESFQQSPSSDQKQNLNFGQLSSKNSYYLMNKSNRSIKSINKEQVQSPITNSPLNNSIYGGIIAIQENQQNSRSRQTSSMVMKISVPVNANSPLSTTQSSLNRTVIAYRPLSGASNLIRKYKESTSTQQKHEDIQSMTSSNYFNSPNNSTQQFNFMPVSPKSDLIVQSSLNSQPSLKIKQGNVNKLYKNYVEQQQNKPLKEQFQLQKQGLQQIKPKTSQSGVRISSQLSNQAINMNRTQFPNLKTTQNS